MSIESWKQEFYPIPARQAEKQDALEHSLRKWKGLLKGNLKKHNIVITRGGCKLDVGLLDIENNDEYPGILSSNSCALCCHYLSQENECEGCPINERSPRNCTQDDSVYYSVYNNFIKNRIWDPIPMIELLQSLKETE